MVSNYKDLEIWKLSLEQCADIYAVTKQFPKEELYGLTSQLRRVTVSVASNIAEGFVRKNSGEFRQFVNISNASNAEIEAQLIIANMLNFIADETKLRLLERNNCLGKKLTVFYNCIK